MTGAGLFGLRTMKEMVGDDIETLREIETLLRAP